MKSNKPLILLVYKSLYQLCKTYDKFPYLKAVLLVQLNPLIGRKDSSGIKDVVSLVFENTSKHQSIFEVSFIELLRNQYKKNKHVVSAQWIVVIL